MRLCPSVGTSVPRFFLKASTRTRRILSRVSGLVSSGIPRLREILLVAGKEIKTPMMEAPFKAGVSQDQREKLHRRMNKLMLSDVVEKVTIKESIGSADTTVVKDTFHKLRHYDVTVTFLNPAQYADKSSVTSSQV